MNTPAAAAALAAPAAAADGGGGERGDGEGEGTEAAVLGVAGRKGPSMLEMLLGKGDTAGTV
jgi:hypothetical protein